SRVLTRKRSQGTAVAKAEAWTGDECGKGAMMDVAGPSSQFRSRVLTRKRSQGTAVAKAEAWTGDECGKGAMMDV
ncbi:hypothetical protein QTL91_24565, partial [Salmonella enterica subsp. enterica serovar Typhimurium]|uniref:hypothetical protein n=1 Tax=Salmonella enterica TaxID=28901 RepID=UPI00261AC160